MTKRWKTISVVGITTALVLMLVLSACGPAAPAEKEKVVKMGYRAGCTGPIASLGTYILAGAVDYVKYFNERGGIDGIEVEIIWRDTGGKVAESIIAHRRFVEQGVVIEQDFASTPSEATTLMQQKDKIPLIEQCCISARMITKPKRWVFSGEAPGFGPNSANFLTWIKETWDKARPPRVGGMHYDYASGWEMGDWVEEYAPELGMEYIGREVIPFIGAIDTTTEWLRLLKKEPDWAYLPPAGTPLHLAIKDAARLGVQQKGVKLYVPFASIEETVIAVCGEAAEGVYSMRFIASADEVELPAMGILLEAAKRYRGWGPEKITGHYVLGWVIAMVSVEAIKQAIAKVGYENLSGEAVRDALVSLKDFETGFSCPLTMSEERPFYPYYRIYQVQQGKVLPISDWKEVTYVYPELKE